MVVVYSITFNDKIVYVGRTDDIKRREYQHNYLYKTGYKKELYKFLRSKGFNEPIKLNILNIFGTKLEAKRYETYLILIDYFGNKELKQKVPNITDR